MKAKSKVQVRTSAGLVEAPCFHQWKQTIGGMEFEFALHIAAGHPKGFVAPLAISELETGFDTKAVLTHPVTRVPLTSSNIQGLKPAQLKSVANAALHNLIHRRVGAGRFLQAMLGAQMQLNKIDLSKYEEGGEATAGLAKPGTATISGKATPEQADVLTKLIDGVMGVCDVCQGTKVVSTTDKDHEGNNIEITCPACIPKAIELPETPVSEMTGGVGFRFDVAMTPGDPACDEYIPSPEEHAQAMADADTMNDNMRKYGTIDKPADDLLHPDVVLTKEDLPALRKKLDDLNHQAAQHGTMTGDLTETQYEDLSYKICSLEKEIADLEGTPCSN